MVFPLDLEYAQLKWGDHNLTLLCPPVGEPYLALPEFFNKILGHRSTLSVQRKEKLGVVTIPATSVQIHTLRVHGSLDAFAGTGGKDGEERGGWCAIEGLGRRGRVMVPLKGWGGEPSTIQ